MTIHREGYKILSITFIVLVILNLALRPFLMDVPYVQLTVALGCLLFFLMLLQFFRSPKREVKASTGTVLAPADGKVVAIEEVDETEYLNERRIQISIFMSPVNVHINWAPVKGLIKYFKYHPGKYLVAWHPKSSAENERTTLVFENEQHTILVRQIAGAMARRIIPYAEEGKSFEQGEEIGFIRFGSRVDVLLPLNAEVLVDLGQAVRGKLTALATLQGKAN